MIRPTLIAVAMGAALTLAGCTNSTTTSLESPTAIQTSEPKLIALEDLRSAVISDTELDGEGWRLAERTVTIGKSDGRSWQPAACGERFTTLFDETLTPPNDDFVTVTYEQPSDSNFRVVTENIARWERPIDITKIAEDFEALITDCPTLTSDNITITLSPIGIDGAAAIRIAYGTAAVAFNLDIAYAPVGGYLVGVTNTGVETTDTELAGLVMRATDILTRTIAESEAIPTGVTSA